MWKHIFTNLLVSVLLLQGTVSSAIVHSDLEQTVSPASIINQFIPAVPEMRVSLQAASKPNIVFITQNGVIVKEKHPEKHALPHLVLKRNGFLTPGYERTLYITISEMDIPTEGVIVTLTIETQHVDPDLRDGNGRRLIVWQEAIEMAENVDISSLKFTAHFDEYTHIQGKIIPTPTDYFRTRITVSDLEGQKLQEKITDFAFLMENQWQVPLPHLLEATPGAAPQRLAIYFCDMFPFVVNANVPDGHLQRAEVEHYVQVKLIPEMVKAIHTQTNLWGFPWYAEWKNNRQSEEQKTLSVALTVGDTWYHGPAPTKGHAAISIRVDGNMSEYETLTDGIMSTFHHELFHNLQRNISLHFTGRDDIEGPNNAWKTVSEGTATLATSVGQSVVQFERSKGLRVYLTRARGFLGSEGSTGGNLNRSYEKITYNSAIYWRFLYEQCGGMVNGIENPAAGMKVIRRMLETLYKTEIVDVVRKPDIVQDLPRLMDRAFANANSCPFNSYAESLDKFAKTIYQLREDGGRCLAPGLPKGCGFYDPKGLYPVPPTEIVALTSFPRSVSGEIPSSYGIDFIMIHIPPGLHDQPLTAELKARPGSRAQFSVQVVKTKNINCFSLIVTRLDGNEKTDTGDYQIVIDAR